MIEQIDEILEKLNDIKESELPEGAMREALIKLSRQFMIDLATVDMDGVSLIGFSEQGREMLDLLREHYNKEEEENE